MRYDQIKQRVNTVNRQLLEMSFTWDMIDRFWDDVLKEAKEDADKH